MNIRREPTYLSTEVWRALLIIAKAREQTPDELANEILDSAIRANFPSVVTYLNEVHKLERDIIKAIGGKNASGE